MGSWLHVTCSPSCSSSILGAGYWWWLGGVVWVFSLKRTSLFFHPNTPLWRWVHHFPNLHCFGNPGSSSYHCYWGLFFFQKSWVNSNGALQKMRTATKGWAKTIRNLCLNRWRFLGPASVMIQLGNWWLTQGYPAYKVGPLTIVIHWVIYGAPDPNGRK